MALIALAFYGAFAMAATPAGTVISNQASAIFQDANGQWQRVTSNIVQTTIQQVAAIALNNDQSVRAESGATTRFVHRVTNSGNGDDRFNLSVTNETADDFELSALSIYADQDENGLPDNNSVIAISPLLAPGGSFSFVVEGQLPQNVSVADTASVLVAATSTFNATLSVDNTDTVSVGQGAVLQVSKQFSVTSGVLSAQAFDTVITVRNVGSGVAEDIELLDALPAGMEYVANSATLNASLVFLTDSDATDTQAIGTLSVRFCAYHASCTGLPESNLDADASSVNQLTLLMDSLAAGETASLRFSVTVATDSGADELINRAELGYQTSGSGTTVASLSNPAIYRVLPTVGVVANGSTLLSSNGLAEPVTVNAAAQAGRVFFSNRIWNTGSRVDTFNMSVDSISSTLPAGSVVQLLQADSQTPLLDSNQDGIADTGPVQPGTFVTIVLALQLPPDAIGNNGGLGFSISKTARSANDSRVSDSVADTLNAIDTSSVDMTNAAPAGTALALGEGAGPELSPVTTQTLDRRGMAVFDLFVRHSGNVPDQYHLSAASSPAGVALPNGVQVSFVNPSSGLPLVSTGLLADGAHAHVQAVVHVTDYTLSDTLSLYFMAMSPTTSVVDIKHDAIQGLIKDDLVLSPNLSAYVSPGESVVYKHRLMNTGNRRVDGINLDIVHDQAGWPVALFSDTDGSGLLSSADTPLPAGLSLEPEESITVFLKVFAPANAVFQQRAVSRVTARWNAGTRSTMIEDISTVSEATVMILKEQAVDEGCDGAPDVIDGFVTVPLAVEPGNTCVIYRLTATNQGSATSYSVAIHDSTPPYTRYAPPATCSHPACQLSEPALEAQGRVKAVVSSLLAGESFRLQFSVRVE